MQASVPSARAPEAAGDAGSIADAAEYSPDAADEAIDNGEEEDSYPEADDPIEEEMDNRPIAAVVMKVTAMTISKEDLIEIGRVAEDIGKDAALIVHGQLALLLSTGGELEHFGMERCQKVYLLGPTGCDVSDCQALIVYARGKTNVCGVITDWFADTDPALLADQILDSVKGRKVLLFGSTQADGWESIAST